MFLCLHLVASNIYCKPDYPWILLLPTFVANMHLLYNQHLFYFPISHLLWPGSFIFNTPCPLSRLKRHNLHTCPFFSRLIFLCSLNDHHYTPACLFYRPSIYHLLFWPSLWSKYCFDLYYMYSCCTVLVTVSGFSEDFNYKTGFPMINMMNNMMNVMMNKHVRRKGHTYLKCNMIQDLKTYCFILTVCVHTVSTN